MLACPVGMQAPSTSGADADNDRLARHAQLYQQAELYYAYDMMYKSTTCPFRTVFATTLFNAACFLLMRLPQVCPQLPSWHDVPESHSR